MRKRLGMVLGAVLLAIALLAGCSSGQPGTSSSGGSAKQEAQAAVSGNLTVKMLDVGQGDAILVQTPTQTVLIDTSDLDEQDKLAGELQKAGVKKIDKLILSHPHADHIGGVEGVVLKNYEVGEVYDNGMPSTSKIYLRYMKILKQKGIQRQGLVAGDVIDLGGGAKFTVFAPSKELVAEGQQKGYKHDPNNESVVGKLTFGEFSMLFTGDAEKQEESEILQSYQNDLKSDVLKSGHHGSKTSSSPQFLQAVQPKYALISCGLNNDYGHPHAQTMKKYHEAKYTIYETDKNGTITVTTDGKKYDVQPEKGSAQ